jgi:3-phenylpropionate/cinnamic acid dioxygenase small subunit
MTPPTQTAIDELLLWHEINQFYIREARLLDDQEFKSWVDLFADDCAYWVPIVSNRIGREIGLELTKPGELAHFEEDKTSLRNRAKRLDSGRAWAETPPGRTRHFITNVELEAHAVESELKARSSFLLWRSHMETDQEIFSGCRHDVLRRTESGFSIARREVILDHAVLTQKSLGVFF